MGFGAKVNLLSLFISVFIPLMLFITERHCASIKAKSWPFMKTYDIWGTDAKTPNDSEEQSRKKHTEPEYKVIKSAMNENTVLSNDNILLQDYDDHKTSFRDGKGKETHTERERERECCECLCCERIIKKIYVEIYGLLSLFLVFIILFCVYAYM